MKKKIYIYLQFHVVAKLQYIVLHLPRFFFSFILHFQPFISLPISSFLFPFTFVLLFLLFSSQLSVSIHSSMLQFPIQYFMNFIFNNRKKKSQHHPVERFVQTLQRQLKKKKKIKEKFQKEIHLKFHFLRVLLMCIEGFEVSELFVVVPQLVGASIQLGPKEKRLTFST